MHYIWLLRAPAVVASPDGLRTTLTLAITTDLGDAFLCPDEPVDLVVTADVRSPAGVVSCVLSRRGELRWRAGLRVLKPALHLPHVVADAVVDARRDTTVDVRVAVAAAELSAAGLRHVLEASAGGCGLVMPVRVALDAEADRSTRRLRLGPAPGCPPYLDFDEAMGESIAGHVWDAGVVALAAVAGASDAPAVQALRRVLDGGGNVLELGCGVGILGGGLAACRRGGGTVLLTDVGPAAALAEANMRRLAPGAGAALRYEELDWEAGRQGRLGPEARRRRWDAVVLSDCTYNADALPALVGTLSALHAHNARLGGGATRLFAATKPRHASERAFFDLVAAAGWRTLERQAVPLPVLGAASEAVELYLFAKG